MLFLFLLPFPETVQKGKQFPFLIPAMPSKSTFLRPFFHMTTEMSWGMRFFEKTKWLLLPHPWELEHICKTQQALLVAEWCGECFCVVYISQVLLRNLTVIHLFTSYSPCRQVIRARQNFSEIVGLPSLSLLNLLLYFSP